MARAVKQPKKDWRNQWPYAQQRRLQQDYKKGRKCQGISGLYVTTSQK